MQDSTASDVEYDLDSSNQYKLSRDNSFLYGQDNFRIELQLETLQDGETGVFLHMHRSLTAKVDSQGHINFSLTTSDGDFQVRSSEPVYAAAGEHDIALVFDGQLGVMQIEVDGTVQAQTTATGTTTDVSKWGLTLGNTWNASLDGTFEDFHYYNNAAVDVQVAGGTGSSVATVDTDFVPQSFLSFENTVFDEVDSTTSFRKMGGIAEYATGVDGSAYHLNGSNSIGYNRGELDMSAVDSFAISFDFQRTNMNSGGQLLDQHKIMDTVIDDQGYLHVKLVTSTGSYHLTSQSASFDDTAWHDTTIAYDSATATLSMEIDDELTVLNNVTGPTADQSRWGLSIGNSWHGSIEGNIDNFGFASELPSDQITDLFLG